MRCPAAGAWLVALLCCSAAIRGQAPPQTSAPFRTAVDVVTVDVTVTDAAGRMLPDLERDEFVVFEDNRPQTIMLFQNVSVPLTVSLLIDSSASMQESLPVAKEAAIGFISALEPIDVASIVDFDSRVRVTQGFTNDRAALEDAIRRTSAGRATSLYNALYIALRELDRKVESDHVGDLRRRRSCCCRTVRTPRV